MDATTKQQFILKGAKVLRDIYPDGLQPSDYVEACTNLEVGFRILDLSIQLVPVSAEPKNPPQSDAAKLDTLIRASVEQKGTFAGVPAKVDGLSKGARAVLDCVSRGVDTVKAIMKVTSYNRSYIYMLTRELRETLGAQHFVETQDGRAKKYTFKN